ncbi:MAG: recombinase family protein [Patescibacteria group bacterium]
MSKAQKINLNKEDKTYEGRIGLIYARVSSKRQETDGTGLMSQDSRCVKELDRLSIPYDKTFPDSYSGGGDFMKRPAMRELLAYIDANPHKKFLVVFDDLKRFARDAKFHFELKTAFHIRDVKLLCLNYNFDESAEGKFVELMFAGQAQLEREQNRRQVIQKQKARLDLGYWPFGAKKGYQLIKDPVHGKLSIATKEGLEVLKPALENFALGVFVRKIDVCRFLVEKGFWTKQSPEKYIDKLTQILKDPFHMGDIEYPIWEVSRRRGKHEGIISAETFDLIQKRLKKEDSGIRIRRDVSSDFPLRNLVLCAHCLNPLTAAWTTNARKKSRWPYYVCHTKGCEAYGKSLRKNDVEDGFIAILQKNNLKPEVGELVTLMFDRTWGDETKKESGLHQQDKDHKDSLSNEIALLAKMAASAKSEAVRSVYEGQIEGLAEQIESLDGKLAIKADMNIPYRTALDKSTTMLKSPYKAWINLDLLEQRRLFYFIFDTKLPYSQKEGYRTNEVPTAIRLFEEFATTNPSDVEMGEIESPCRRFL